MHTHREYDAYLDSPEWWSKRKYALQRADYSCERCGAPGPLEVHHRQYTNLGNEAGDELEVLCAVCHGQERLPRNLQKRALELFGQERLFDRWDESPTRVQRAA